METMTSAKKDINGFKFKDDELPKDQFAVYRKRWLWGEKLFIICENIIRLEDVVILKNGEETIAILPKESFSCAINVKHIQE